MEQPVKKASNLPQRWVVMGVSGCGKSEVGSRLAARLGVDHFEGDSDHPPANIAKMVAGVPLDDSDRQGWLLLLQARIRDAAAAGRGLVLSCSALKRRYRDLLREGDPDLVFVHLHGDRELIASRMRARPGHFMPVKLLDSQFADLELLGADERGLQLDIKDAPDALVEQAVQYFSSRGQEA
jgi:gluconokinase